MNPQSATPPAIPKPRVGHIDRRAQAIRQFQAEKRWFSRKFVASGRHFGSFAEDAENIDSI
jgi:hypothetical protein